MSYPRHSLVGGVLPLFRDAASADEAELSYQAHFQPWQQLARFIGKRTKIANVSADFIIKELLFVNLQFKNHESIASFQWQSNMCFFFI